MDWATGIGVNERAFVGELCQADGSTLQVPLCDLAARGLPTAGAFRLRVESDLRTWVTTDPNRYRSAFGIAGNCGCPERHQVFTFSVKGLEVLVPALALMRAFFRPKKHLLRVMFGPQSLDRVCHLDHSVTPPALVIDAHWASEGYSAHYGQVSQPLSWLQSFPSATRMAASVHSCAVDGSIGLLLPEAMCRIAVRGLRRNNTFFATELTIVELLSLEQPFVYASGHTARIAFYDVASDQKVGRNNNIKVDTAIPRCSDGGVELTDTEWEKIQPLLLEGACLNKLRLDQRRIFNGVLTKLALGIQWRTVQYSAGTWNNARYAHRCWVQRGTFQKAIEKLAELRPSHRQPDSARQHPRPSASNPNR